MLIENHRVKVQMVFVYKAVDGHTHKPMSTFYVMWTKNNRFMNAIRDSADRGTSCHSFGSIHNKHLLFASDLSQQAHRVKMMQQVDNTSRGLVVINSFINSL